MTDIKDIKTKAVKGSVWSFIEKFSLQIVQFIIATILARLLGPKEYGLIALTTIFTGICAAIIDGGFEKTLIKQKELSSIEINTAFYLNMVLGLTLTVIFIFISPAIASFFQEPGLTIILQVVSLGLIIESLSQVQRTLLIKELNFKKITYSQVTSSVITGATGIIFAYQGLGVWSLVYSALIGQLVRLIFYWTRSDWYPGLQFSIRSIRSIIPYGINVLFTSILFFVIQQFNNFIVGKFYTREQLGLFNRGARLPELTLGILQSVVVKLSFPLFSKLQDDTPQLQNALRKTTKLIAFIAIPMLTILLLNAEELTILLFTEKWRGSIIFLECFCVIKFFEPIIAVEKEMLLARGQSKLLLWLSIILAALEIILILAFMKYGILYVILATFISKAVQYIIYIIAVSRNIELAWYTQLKWLLPYLAISIPLYLLDKPCHYLLSLLNWENSMLMKASLKVITSLLLYYTLAYKIKVDEIAMVKNIFGMFSRKAGSIIKRRTQLEQN